MPSCPHCMYNRFIIKDLDGEGKNIALTYALMPSLYCEAEFCIKCLNAVIYILFIGYSVLM